ncbi:S-layer homology domain-containing protein [Tepidibacillus decaturensis]|uniref:SLH domain-containing protein n=1 Tax=Tepidibacillus decaturensis TaxID=1413211 RepID=A0A135L6T2_9BACI|nr:S-layer homology domain-containing protein [Tepidibacillus decaturensis]KXG44523.1 hypothetical protein U473_11220 [Tepidibacillus decaturensis]
MREQSYKRLNNSQPNRIRGGETKVMRKLLNAFLVFALVLTMVTPAFAASTTEDLGDYAYAVNRLSALKVLTGNGDGTFKVDSTITRAEFAAMAVRLLGLEAVAKASAGATPFKDGVADWASGYVNVAVQQGIVTGYADGRFGEKDPVTQAQALAMLVRALGYDPAVAKEGWPTNYIVKAIELGLTDGVDNVSAYAPAKRGDVFKFADNALFVDKYVQTGTFNGQPTYAVAVGKTLLTDNLKVAKKTGIVVGSKAVNFSDKELLDGQVAIDVLKADGTVDSTVVFNANDTDAATLLGHKVSFFANDDDLVIVEDGSNTVVTVPASDIDTVNTTTYAFKYDLDGIAKTLDITGAELVFNGQKDTLNSVSKVEPDSGNVVLVDNDADKVYDFVFTTDYDTFLVQKVWVEDKQIDTTSGTSLDLSDENYTVVIKKDGKEIGLSDLNKYDVIEVQVGADATNTLYTINVLDSTVDGKIEEVVTSSKVVIGGTTYSVAADETTGLTFDNSVLGKEGTFYLDNDGKIFEFVAKAVENNADNYAYVKDTKDTSDTFAGTKGLQYKLWLTDGTTKVFDVASKVVYTDSVTTATYTLKDDFVVLNSVKDKMVKYELNAEGQVDSLEVLNPDAAATALIYDKDASKLGGYVVNSNTVVYFYDNDAVDPYTGDTGVFTGADLKDAESYTTVAYGVSSTKYAEVVFISDASFATPSSDAQLIVVDKVTSVLNADGDTVNKVYGFVDGKAVTVLAENGVVVSAARGDVIEVTYNSKGEIDSVPVVNYDASAKTGTKVDAKSDTTIVVGGFAYNLADTVYVYNYNTTDDVVTATTYASIKSEEQTLTNYSKVYVHTNTKGLVDLIVIDNE